MDPFSHIALGRTLAALRPPSDRGRGAILAVALGALAPDVDAVLMPFGWDIYLRAHEIGTHSLLGSLAVAALTALVVRLFVRGSRYRALAGAAWAGSLSHLALDVLSGAQIRLGWPLLDRQVSLPLVAMAEPALIAIFFTGSIAILATRRGPARRQRLAAIGVLVAVCTFLGLKGILLTSAMSSAGLRSQPVVQPVIEARWASLTEWYVYDRTTEALRLRRVRAGGDPVLVLSWPIRAESSLVRSSRSLPAVKNFLRVHDLGFAVERPDPAGGTRVLWSDIRFCWAPDDGTDISPALAPIGTAADGGIACGLWFGGTFDARGRAVTQLVQVGEWAQTRDP